MTTPVNDDFANATAFTGNTVGDNTGATVEGGEDLTYTNTSGAGSSVSSGAHTVWYSYTATADSTVTFHSYNSGGEGSGGTDTHLQVFEGGDDAAHQVAEGDLDFSTDPFYFSSTATFNAVAGHTYDIQVGSFPDAGDSNNQGAFNLDETDSPACYLRGTAILTSAGEVAIEDLAIGDTIVAASGAHRAIKWIGRRSHGASAGKYRPIRIAAGALGENLPHRDLQVSPRHAMLLDGLLIEARWLLNGVTITQPARSEDIQYFHVELDSHDVLVAEGAASESFLGAAKRHRFDNGAEFAALYPGEYPNPFARPCAPRAADGFAFQAVCDRLAARAGLSRVA